MRKISFLIAVLAVFLFSGCASTTKGGAIGADRSQFMIVSEQTMDQNAKLAYQQTINKAKSVHALNTNPSQTKQVREISKNLIKQVGFFREDAINWDWQINVIKSDEVNAWCMPGGKIAVFTGLLNTIKPTNAELAAVIGHEIAHALREHSRERASTESAKNLGISVLAAAVGLDDTATGLVNMASQYTFSLPFSRKHESEADIIGLELMAHAGYDPNAALNLWKKMSKLNVGKKPAEFFSTHPSDENRIESLQKMLPKVMPIYEASKKQK